MSKRVRVRYAPSPSGYLHIGGARSALFNYLFAKNQHGDFVVRVEDTDFERNIEGAEESQIQDLEWLGIIADESPIYPNPKYAPYRQSEKLELYREYAEKLVQEGKAYYCYCSEEELAERKEAALAAGVAAPQYDGKCLHLTPEEIEAYKLEGRKPTIRIKMEKEKDIIVNDLVRGKVEFNTRDIGDWVIIKSNGIATYNFAVVIDDHIMEITHVLRGEEHLSNTPKQIQVYDYFGWEAPEFGHMTLIINENGKKLSKRDLNILQFMSQYRNLGYLPKAIFNFILLLGWSPGGEKEFFTMEEAIEAFSLARLSKSPSTFDPQKMMWMNSHYIKELSDEEYLEFIKPFLLQVFTKPHNDEYYLHVANLFKNEIKYGAEIVDLLKPIVSPVELEDEELLEMLATPLSQEVLKAFKKHLLGAEDLESDTIKGIFNNVKVETGAKGKLLFMPVRVALTSQMHGLEMAQIFNILGKDLAVERLDKAIKN